MSRKNALRVAVSLAALLALALAPHSAPAGSGTTTYSLPVRLTVAPVRADLEAAVVTLLNRERARSSLPLLTADGHLRVAARMHAKDMLAFGYFSHRSRDGKGPTDRAFAAGANVRIVGENLAFAASVGEAHRALMASPGHRKNILYPSFHRVGVAVMTAGSHGIIVVQNFAD